MMVFALRNRARLLVLPALKACLVSLFMLHTGLQTGGASAQMNIEEWKNYGQLAEQGAICAGFASIMESQRGISSDVGILWKERRKFSGSIIRNAGQLETGTPPKSKDIDGFIIKYREWILANLIPINSDEESDSGSDSNIFAFGQGEMRQILKTNCVDIFQMADETIIERFPKLDYLFVDNQPTDKFARGTPEDSANREKITELEGALQNLQATNRALTQSNRRLNQSNQRLNQKLALVQQKLTKVQTPVVIPKPKVTPKTRPKIVQKTIPAAKAPKIEKPVVKKLASATKVAKAVIKKAPPKKITPKAVVKKALLKKSTPKVANANAAKTPKFIAQLGSFKRTTNAARLVKEVSSKLPSKFKTVTFDVKAHTMPSGDIIHRVLSQPVGLKAARDLCAAVKAEKIGCFVKNAP